MLRFDRADDERGMSVIELTIASMILMIVLAVLFSGLMSLTRSEKRAGDQVTNEQSVRFVMTQLTREIRAANPLITFTTKTTYSNQIEVVYGPTGGAQKVLRYRYDNTIGSATYQTLFREVMSDATSSATVLTSAKVLEHVRNDQLGATMFTYYGQHQEDLVATSSYTSADVANCAIRVRVTLISDSSLGPAPFTQQQDVELRNRLPGGIGCG